MHSSWEAKQKDAAVGGSFTPVSLFVYEDPHNNNNNSCIYKAPKSDMSL